MTKKPRTRTTNPRDLRATELSAEQLKCAAGGIDPPSLTLQSGSEDDCVTINCSSDRF